MTPFLVIKGGGGPGLFRIPWTYVPGNHDDDDAPWSRSDLLEIYELPGCVAKGAKSFNHTVTVGSCQGAEKLGDGFAKGDGNTEF